MQGATLQITGTGASLDRGLAMPDIALDPGATVDIVLRCKVKREEAGELELPLNDNGQPQTVGEVLDGVLDIAEQAETDTAARGDRMAELHTWGKPALVARAGELQIAGRHDLTKNELVEQIADWETEESTDG